MAELKTGNFLSDWMQDRIYDTVTEDAQGKLNAGPLMGALGGALGYNVNAIAEQKGIDVDNRGGRDLLRELGETRLSAGIDEDADISRSGVAAAIKKRNRKEKEDEETKLRGYRKEDSKSALEQTLAVGEQGIKANAAEGRLSRAAAQDQYLHSTKSQNARYAHERSEGRLDRRHQAELADSKDSLQMQMAIMQNDLAEKRMDYDRETARMDKRSAAIAQLMSGLGSLGGAFAL
jgi:hypothetical protein